MPDVWLARTRIQACTITMSCIISFAVAVAALQGARRVHVGWDYTNYAITQSSRTGSSIRLVEAKP